MLNYRNTLVVFLIILVITVVIDYLIHVYIGIYISLVTVFILVLVWGSKSISSGFYMNSTCHGSRLKREIVLSFDDGPDAQVTPLILDVLKKHKVKAVFFVIGSKAEKHPEIIQRIDKEGHLIGSHSYSHHFLFDLFPFRKMRAELKKTENIISRITGRKMLLFRPPYGVTNPVVARTVRSLGYFSIGWSIKSNDTVVKDDTVIFNKITSTLKNGDILLFHDNKPWTVKVIDNLIPYIKENEIVITDLGSLLNLSAYAL